MWNVNHDVLSLILEVIAPHSCLIIRNYRMGIAINTTGTRLNQERYKFYRTESNLHHFLVLKCPVLRTTLRSFVKYQY